MDIIKIHAAPITKKGDIGEKRVVELSVISCSFWFVIDYESIVKLTDDFNGADLRNVCTEAGGCVAMYL